MDGTSLGEATPEVPVTTQPISLVEADDYIRGIITKIATLMKPETEKKLGRSFAIFNPVYYMKKGSINYCLRVSGLVNIVFYHNRLLTISQLRLRYLLFFFF